MLDCQIDDDGIVTLTLDMPDRSMNVTNQAVFDAIVHQIDEHAANPDVKGFIVTSGKAAFAAGADVSELDRLGDPEVPVERIYELSDIAAAAHRRLETCGKPVVAAINGTALGGGYELCLATHRRIVADDPGIQIGLPEVGLGLLPGGGGTQRLPRMLGLKPALDLLIDGTRLAPAAAHAAGLVDEVVPADDLLAAARRWLLGADARAVQPWDDRGYRLPGGAPFTTAGMQIMVGANALVQARTWHNYPAPVAILSCVFEGVQVQFDAGIEIERRYFTQLVRSVEARNIIRSTFVNKRAADKLVRRPKGIETMPTRKVAILGAGLMGSGIGYVAARAGIDVVLLDTDLARAEKGKAYSAGILDKQVARGNLQAGDASAILARITPTTAYEDIASCDLVIEAVIEDRAIKAGVTGLTEAQIDAGTVFASNTSTLPITGLAEASKRPENFIGMHFFSPVEKMPLVEIIVGAKTSDRAVAKALDFVRQVKKTPIVVNDSRGFYTSRVVAKYIHEGCHLLAEGVEPALIENAARLAGMPVGPLNLVDETKIDLAYHIIDQSRTDMGDAYRLSKAENVIVRMYDLGRWGKLSGKGFYDYPEGGGKHLWPGLAQEYPPADRQPDVEEVKMRLLYSMAVDTARLLEENVLTDPADADIGAIYGFGYPRYTGGPISLIDMVGCDRFVADCRRLADAHGERFAPPEMLVTMAREKRSFYGTQPAEGQG